MYSSFVYLVDFITHSPGFAEYSHLIESPRQIDKTVQLKTGSYSSHKNG